MENSFIQHTYMVIYECIAIPYGPYGFFISQVTLVRGGEDFGKLPFWAHLLPAALAQFHTILALIAFSNGLPDILGCESISQSLLFSPAKSRCL